MIGHPSTGSVGSFFMDMGGLRMDVWLAHAECRAWHVVGLPQLGHFPAMENHVTSRFPQEDGIMSSSEVHMLIKGKVPPECYINESHCYCCCFCCVIIYVHGRKVSRFCHL